jgi:hypothetical protein
LGNENFTLPITLSPVGLDHLVFADIGFRPIHFPPIDQLAVLGADLEVPLAHQCAAAQQARPYFAHLDGFRHFPRRPESDPAHGAGEDRRLLADLSSNDALRQQDLPALDHALRVLGNVVPDIELAHVGWHPAPLLHVGQQLLGFGAGGVAGFALGAAAEENKIFLAQPLELRMLWMQAAKVGFRTVGGRDAIQDQPWLQQLRPAVEVGAQLLGWMDDAPAAGVATIFQDSSRKAHFGLGCLFGRQSGLRRGACGARTRTGIVLLDR